MKLTKLTSPTDVALTARDRERLAAHFAQEKGGPGSGNFGHAGRPGEVGGSGPGGSAAAQQISDSEREYAQEHEEWRADWQEQNNKLAAKDPEFKKLLGELRKIDPGAVLPIKSREQEPDLNLLAERGKLFSTAGWRMVKGEPNQCHANASRLFDKGKADNIVTGYGYAKGRDMWFQHSWGLKQGTIVETTVRFDKYYGVKLSTDESVIFSSRN